MTVARIAITVFFAVLVAGCGTTAIIERNSPGLSSGESIIVIGVKPEGSRIQFFTGTITGNEFKEDSLLGGAVINGVPKDGYVVARAKAGQVIGLTQVVIHNGGFSGRAFNACGGTRAPAFEVPGGQLIYLADIEYAPAGQRLSVTYASQLQAAAEHLHSNYPNLKGDLRQLVWEPLPTASPCVGTYTVIPIYIGR